MKNDKLKGRLDIFWIDPTMLNSIEKVDNPTFAIGIDQYDKDVNACCLMRKFNGVSEVVLQKTIRDEDEFKIEVDNLAKYFNAEKI